MYKRSRKIVCGVYGKCTFGIHPPKCDRQVATGTEQPTRHGGPVSSKDNKQSMRSHAHVKYWKPVFLIEGQMKNIDG